MLDAISHVNLSCISLSLSHTHPASLLAISHSLLAVSPSQLKVDQRGCVTAVKNRGERERKRVRERGERGGIGGKGGQTAVATAGNREKKRASARVQRQYTIRRSRCCHRHCRRRRRRHSRRRSTPPIASRAEQSRAKGTRKRLGHRQTAKRTGRAGAQRKLSLPSSSLHCLC